MPPIRLPRRARPSLLALALLAAVLPASAAAAEPCAGPITLLVDRSASMADHDPFGALRIAIAEAFDVARPAVGADVVRPFDARLGAPIPAHPQGWSAAVAAALAGGDRGATALADVIDVLGGAGGLVVVTDAEAALGADGQWPAALGALIVVGGAVPAPLRDAASAAAHAPVLSVRTAAAAGAVVRRLCSGRAGVASPQAVLVSGLRTTTAEVRGASTVEACRPAGPLAGWCAALVADGERVWVPGAAPGRRGRAVLDSTGRLADNAVALRAWWRRLPHGAAPPVLIGHSMGGLIAHAAIREGLPAAALVTVGTPHAGSYGADAYFAARAVASACALRCPVTAAGLLGATVALRRRFGAALGDLTREQRTQVAPLGTPAVPLATWAGTTSRAPSLPSVVPIVGRRGDGYVTPNDGIVGQGSATGALAGLHPTLGVADGAARHSVAVPPKRAATQLGSTIVAEWIVAAAHTLGSASGGSAGGERVAVRAHGTRAVTRPRPSKAPRAAATLRTVGALEPGAEQPVRPDALVVATAPMGLRCDDAEVALAEVRPGLWFLDLGTLGCRGVRIDAPAAPRAWLLEAASGSAAAASERLLAVRRARARWTVELRLSGPGRPVLRRGRQRLALRPVRARTEWEGSRRWRAEVRGRGATEISVRVRATNVPPRVAAVDLP